MQQWKDENVERELNKFFAGVQNRDNRDAASLPAVATGNWGCGNFGGYHDLKALVQWMAASEAGRPLIYFTFGEPGLAQQLRELAALLVQKSVTVGALISSSFRLCLLRCDIRLVLCLSDVS
jgi:poly(ADP-ribose) glycohydrolase